MAAPRPRPVTNSFSRDGIVSAFTCVAEQRSHLRTATASSICRPIARTKAFSSVSLPSLTRTRQHITELSLGVDARRSAFRSLSSNPKLAVNVVKGSVNIVRRENTPYLPRTTKTIQGVEASEREVLVSREGYHARSTSPTYQTLLLAKAQIEVLLARKLREIGDSVRCHQDNIAGPERLQSSSIDQQLGPDSDFEDYVSDMDSKRLIRPVRFGSAALRANKDNMSILELNEKDVADRLREWKHRNSTNLPKLERLDPEIGFTRPCYKNAEADVKERERFLFLKKNTSRQVIPTHFRRKPKTSLKKQYNKENIVANGADTVTNDRTPLVEANSPNEKKIDFLSVVQADSSEDKIDTENNSSRARQLKELDYDRARGLLICAGSQPKKPIASSIDPNPVSDCPDEDEREVKPLTAKEKFIRMQGRMAEIQRKKRDKMSSFADYSYMIIDKKKTQSRMKKLGVNLSKRLENMTVFQSKEKSQSDDDVDLLLDVSDISDSDDDVI